MTETKLHDAAYCLRKAAQHEGLAQTELECTESHLRRAHEWRTQADKHRIIHQRPNYWGELKP